MLKKIVFTLFLTSIVTAWSQQPSRMQGQSFAADNPLNPLNYGLLEATTGMERYNVLLTCHREAVESQRPISYAGIDTIRLDIVERVPRLPLPYNTDFAGAVIVVNNRCGKDITLFSLAGDQEPKHIDIDKATLDGDDFRAFSEFRTGSHLLILGDRTPWSNMVDRRMPVYRYDLLLIDGGHATNRPIASYSGEKTLPECLYVPITSDQKSIENVTIIRDRKSKQKTFCFLIAHQNNVLLNNIKIFTPKGMHNGDQAITVVNSANCVLRNITADSSYSYAGKAGFIFSMNNVLNCRFENVKVNAVWPPFELYNMSNVQLVNSDVDRFDILCYGKDVHVEGCTFDGKSMQFSSLYGDLNIDNCTFNECNAVTVRSTYNTYTPFDINMRHCTMNISRDNNAVVNMMLHSSTANRRPELAARCWPNVNINDLTVNVSKTAKRLEIIAPTGNVRECDKPVDHIRNITVDGLHAMSKGKPAKCDLYLSRHHFKTVETFTSDCRNLELNGGETVNYINK